MTAGNRVPYDGLRQWLEKIEAIGELRLIEGVTIDDVSKVSVLLAPSITAPAVMFDDIQNYPKGFRVLVNAFNSWRRFATVLGESPEAGARGIKRRAMELFKNVELVPPVVVDSGPVMENIYTDDEVDVDVIPVPKWHDYDGGRYIGTGCYTVTKDPDEGFLNCGTYRVMIHDKNHVGFYVAQGHQGQIMRDKYLSRNQPCPVAVVIGDDPLLFVATTQPIPYGICEYDWAGGVRRKPYRVFEGKVTGLPLPADAEIILEGFAYPGVKKLEGRFGEWTGYFGGDAIEEPVIEVKAIYHRNDPIHWGMPPHFPPDDCMRYQEVVKSALLHLELQNAGVPDVADVWCPAVAGTRFLVIVAIRQRYPGHARQAGHAAMGCRIGAYAGRYVIVVDDDIDVTDLNKVIWAVCTRSDPETSIDIAKRAWGGRLDPRINPEDKRAGNVFNSRAIIDATKPWEWFDRYPIVNAPSPETLKDAQEKWGFLLEEK